MACQEDPADEFASEDLYFDNAYHLDGTPWAFGGTFLGLTDTPAAYAGHALEVVRVNAATNALEFSAAGSGDVSAAANLTDNTIIRGDGGAKGVQDSGITISDADDIDMNGGAISNVGNVDGVDVSAHASRHAVSGTDTVFPADPNADKFLMWDDVPGNLSWEDAGGGATDEIYDADNDTKVQTEEAADEDKIRFDTAAVERMLIDSDGSVTITTQEIADNHVVSVDDADAADNDFAKFTANGLEGRSYSEVLSDLSGQAGAAFDFNDKNLTQVGTIEALGIWDDDTDTGVQVEEAADEDYIRFDTAGSEAGFISDAGIFTLSLQPAAKMYQNAAGTSCNNAVLTKILFDAEVYDTASEGDLVNDYIEVTEDGLYYIQGSVRFAAMNDTNAVICGVRVNAVYVASMTLWCGKTGDAVKVAADTVYFMSAGDQIDLYAWQNSGGAKTTSFGDEFYTYLLAVKLW